MEELKKAPVTVLLILANILVFTAVEFTGGSEDTMHMLQCGAAYTPAICRENTIGSLQVCSFILDRSILEITCWYCLCLEADWSVQLEN